MECLGQNRCVYCFEEKRGKIVAILRSFNIFNANKSQDLHKLLQRLTELLSTDGELCSLQRNLDV